MTHCLTIQSKSPFNIWSLLYWRRQWHPTPVLLPGKSQGQRSLVRLQSMGSLRVGHDWATSLSLFTFMHWRRKWRRKPTPLFSPGESQGWGAWWAAVCGVAHSRTWLKQLSSSTSVHFFFNIMGIIFKKYSFLKTSLSNMLLSSKITE